MNFDKERLFDETVTKHRKENFYSPIVRSKSLKVEYAEWWLDFVVHVGFENKSGGFENFASGISAYFMKETPEIYEKVMSYNLFVPIVAR